jgi:hypothetical protein
MTDYSEMTDSHKLFVLGDTIHLVETLGPNKFIEGGIYIRYANGGTDTTKERFLFDIPEQLEAKG